ncbi:MAG: 30S ribosomal protein S8, partial [Proteobacteria bacterium]|nr:30S ribosomal protein S8 [Pseudomonadota bacterium]
MSALTDPIADLLTRVRNAVSVQKEEFFVPYSKIKSDIIAILQREGYIEEYELDNKETHPRLRIRPRYVGKTPAIAGLRRISRPGSGQLLVQVQLRVGQQHTQLWRRQAGAGALPLTQFFLAGQELKAPRQGPGILQRLDEPAVGPGEHGGAGAGVSEHDVLEVVVAQDGVSNLVGHLHEHLV